MSREAKTKYAYSLSTECEYWETNVTYNFNMASLVFSTRVCMLQGG